VRSAGSLCRQRAESWRPGDKRRAKPRYSRS
jgi:hypothetical protein